MSRQLKETAVYLAMIAPVAVVYVLVVAPRVSHAGAIAFIAVSSVICSVAAMRTARKYWHD